MALWTPEKAVEFAWQRLIDATPLILANETLQWTKLLIAIVALRRAYVEGDKFPLALKDAQHDFFREFLMLTASLPFAHPLESTLSMIENGFKVAETDIRSWT